MTNDAPGASLHPLATMLQLHDSQFPVGAFAYSGGLETYAQEGMDVHALEGYLRTQISVGWGCLDLAAWRIAWDDPTRDALEHLDARVTASMPVPSLRDASRRLGARVRKLALRLWPHLDEADLPDGLHQCVTSGAMARHLGVGGREGLFAFAHANVTSTLAAATRCMPLSPERAQELLVALAGPLDEAVSGAWCNPEARMWTSTPGADLAACHQVRLTTRLFQT